MKHYLGIASKYLAAHRKKTRLAIVSVAISVALVTGIFSMADVLMRFEMLQVIHEYGNYHLAVVDPTAGEIAAIKGRIDVQNSGCWTDLGKGLANGKECRLGALDEAFAGNLNIEVIQGQYPVEEKEIMLEKWAAERLFLNVGIGDRVRIAFGNGNEKEFIISGIYNDFGNMKAAGVPGVFLSTAAAKASAIEASVLYLVEFKEKADIMQAIRDIKAELDIVESRISLNNHLLAVIGQSEHKAATGIYTVGGILFCLVLAAGVVMIYNTFNISVMERVRQFGLLRCVGASQSQIRKLVRKEGLVITMRAIPLGILAGMLMTLVCSAILKYFNNTIFAEIPLFSISPAGMAGGAAVGYLTVFMASLLPAKKASRVSPVNAVTGSSDIKVTRLRKRGVLTKLLRAETAMGINSAFMKKKTFFLMSCSIALSIIMFLGFNVLIDFLHASLKTTKPYTPDISLISEQGISNELYRSLSEVHGVKRVYGRMLEYADICFDASRLTDSYKESMKNIEVKADGLFVPPEKSWLVSYDKNQLKWAKKDLIAGELSEDEMNEKNGIIAVAGHLRNNITVATARLQLGDRVFIDTAGGRKEFTVMGILRTVPFSSPKLTLSTFIVTEEQFTGITGKPVFKVVELQLRNRKDEEAAGRIKDMVDTGITFLDRRQQNTEMNQLYLTMAVFVYGFVAVIALISTLNIINTMNTSIASKTRYLGVIRAVGMSGRQLSRMVLAEAAAYSAIGCAAGCILGVMLQKSLITNYFSSFHMIWKFPLLQITIITAAALLVTILSVVSPLKKVRSKGISEIVNSL